MTTWHRVGDKGELLARVPAAFKLDRWSVAVSTTTVSSERSATPATTKAARCRRPAPRRVRDVSWHAWEYSVVTGKGPEGYDEEQVPSSRSRSGRTGLRPDAAANCRGSSSSTNRRTCSRPIPSPPGRRRACWSSPPRPWTTSTRASPVGRAARAPLDQAKRRGGIRSTSSCATSIPHCEGNYSKAARACTWPSHHRARSEDQLIGGLRGLVHWADVVLMARHSAGECILAVLQMIERLNCVQNQVTIQDKGADQEQGGAFSSPVARTTSRRSRGHVHLLADSASCSPVPSSAHFRGWDAEDMQNNVRQ